MIAAVSLALTLFGSPTQDSQIRVCVLGDSLAERLSQPLSRALGPRFLVKGAQVASPEARSLAMKSDVVLLLIGSEAATREDWPRLRDVWVPDTESFINSVRSSPTRPKVYVCIPPPSNLPDADPRKGRLMNEAIPLLKQAARETDCPVIDLNVALKDRLDLVDGTQPNELGLELIADTIVEAISPGRKADWRVVYADSEEADEGPAKNAIDGDPETYWHTNYSTTADKYPHELRVDTGAERTIGGFSYTPRQDGVNGRVSKYEFYVSLDGKSWGQPVASGKFPAGSDPTKVSFDHPVQCRYFRFRALSEQQGQIWASVGELDLIKFYPRHK